MFLRGKKKQSSVTPLRVTLGDCERWNETSVSPSHSSATALETLCRLLVGCFFATLGAIDFQTVSFAFYPATPDRQYGVRAAINLFHLSKQRVFPFFHSSFPANFKSANFRLGRKGLLTNDIYRHESNPDLRNRKKAIERYSEQLGLTRELINRSGLSTDYGTRHARTLLIACIILHTL